MELMPWRPFGEIGSLRKEMDNLWSRFFREIPSMGAFTEEWLPSADISETRKNFIVKAELPGLDAKDVKVSLSGDLLTIKGEKKRKRKKRTSIIILLRDTPDHSSVPFNCRHPSRGIR